MNIFMRIFSLLSIIIGFIITVTNKKMKWGKQKNTGNSDGTCDFYFSYLRTSNVAYVLNTPQNKKGG